VAIPLTELRQHVVSHHFGSMTAGKPGCSAARRVTLPRLGLPHPATALGSASRQLPPAHQPSSQLHTCFS
jgi:hypothetical protein